MIGMKYENLRPIEINHYEWCKKEGRDISWFKKEEQNVLLESKKIKRTKRKRT